MRGIGGKIGLAARLALATLISALVHDQSLKAKATTEIKPATDRDRMAPICKSKVAGIMVIVDLHRQLPGGRSY